MMERAENVAGLSGLEPGVSWRIEPSRLIRSAIVLKPSSQLSGVNSARLYVQRLFAV